MKWLSLDLSSKTGYAFFEDHKLTSHGLLESPIEDYFTDVSDFTQLPDSYPDNLINSAKSMTQMVVDLLGGVELVVTEHTEGSKFRFSQRYLEWLHLLIIQELKNKSIRFKYLLNSDWRKATNCYVSLWPEYRKWNRQVSKAKKSATPTKTGAMVAKIGGKVVSRVDQKKLSIILANKHFDLEIKDNNIADALNLGRAAIELGLIN